MKSIREFCLSLRLLALLLALFLLPSAAFCEGVEVEDVQITDAGVSRETLLPIDFSAGPALKEENLTESTDENGNPVRIYEDSTIRVVLSEFRWYIPDYPADKKGTTIWVADVTITDPSQLRVASFDADHDFVSTNHKGQIVRLAPVMNAVVAIDGDSWGAEEKHNYGIVLRQEQLIKSRLDEKGKYRMDLLLIDVDGDFHMIHSAMAGDLDDPTEYNGKKILDVFSFGPILVENGKAVEDYQGADRRSNGGTWMDMRTDTYSQRVAFCQVGPLHYMLVASAGRYYENFGLTFRQFGDCLESMGVQSAYNLDGGDSSVLYFYGAGKVNHPKIKQKRDLWDFIYFASGETSAEN